MEQIARLVSAGMPTNQGSQYSSISLLPIISQGWTKIAAPKSAAASKTGKRESSFKFFPFTFEPIWIPASPRTSMHLSNSPIAKSVS